MNDFSKFPKIMRPNYFDTGKKCNYDNIAGFTIIELLVVITIVTVFIIVVISNFSQIRLQFALSRTAYKFNQDLKKAQNMALSSVPYKDSSGVEQAVDGYGVYIDLDTSGNKKYVIYADKYPGNQQYDSFDYIFETVDFSLVEPGVIIKQMDNIVGNQGSINFNSSNLDTKITQLSPGKDSIDITLALESDLANAKIISVNISGLIEVK